MPDDTYLDVLNDLGKLYLGLPSLRLKASHRRITHIAHGWCMRVHRDIEAILLLREHGYAMESWPLRRSLLEHVVAIKWLNVEGSHIADLVRRAHAITAERRRQAVVDAGWSTADLAIFDEVVEDIAATDEHRSFDYLLHFKRRCDAYGTPDDYSAYLIDTARSHPTWETASPYLHRDGGDVSMLREPRFDGSRDDTGFCTMELWEALAAINNMMDVPRWDDALSDARARIERLASQSEAPQA